MLRRATVYRSALYGATTVEPYWQMSGAAYKRVMEAGQWSWRTTPFRGFGRRPFADPLALLQGRAARRRLRAVADGRLFTPVEQASPGRPLQGKEPD